MDKKWKNIKLIRRIKYRNAVDPESDQTRKKLKLFNINLKKKHRMTQCVLEMANKIRNKENKIRPLIMKRMTVEKVREKLMEHSNNCPATTMARNLERGIKRKISHFTLAVLHQNFLDTILHEAKQEYTKITQQIGVTMKIRGAAEKFRLLPLKYPGKTPNYARYLAIRRIIQKKFCLHRPIVRKIFIECIQLPNKLFNLYAILNFPFEHDQFADELERLYEKSRKNLSDIHGKILALIDDNDCSKVLIGLLSVHVSRTITNTLAHVAQFTGDVSRPYLTITINFREDLKIEPNAHQIITIYTELIRKLTNLHHNLNESATKDKRMFNCVTKDFQENCLNTVQNNIQKKFEPILEYNSSLNDEFAEIHSIISSENTIIDLEFEEGIRKVLQMKSHFKKIAYIPNSLYFNIFVLNLTQYRDSLKLKLQTNIKRVYDQIYRQNQWEIDDICEIFDIIHLRATKNPSTTEEIIEISKYIAKVKTEYLDELKERAFKAFDNLILLIDLGEVEPNHLDQSSKMINWLDRILPVLEDNIVLYEQLKYEAEERLQVVVEEISVDIDLIHPYLDLLDNMDDIENVRDYLRTITMHMIKLRKIENKIDWINHEETSLSFPKSFYKDFQDLKNHIYPFYHLLKVCLDVQRNLHAWLDGAFEAINYETTRNKVENYYNELVTTHKNYRNKLRLNQDENATFQFKGSVDDPDLLNWPAPLKLTSKTIKLIEDFKPSVAIIKLMCNEALTERHWKEMSNIAGIDLTPNAGTTLRKLIDLNLTKDQDQYEVISLNATKEKELLDELNEMQDNLNEINFRKKIFGNTNVEILENFQEIMAMIDEYSTRITVMQNSIHIKPHRNTVREFLAILKKIEDIINQIHQVHSSWLRLLPLFLSEEISRRMPNEFAKLQEVNEIYENITGLTENFSLKKIVNETNIFDKLKNITSKLEYIDKNITTYITNIQEKFPRLYFLCKDEIISILNIKENAVGIQMHLKKIFGFGRLKFANKTNALGIIHRNEIFYFRKPQTFTGSIEDWLKNIEYEMKFLVHSLVINARDCYTGQFDEDFINKFPIQIICILSQILFTDNVNNRISSENLEDLHQQILIKLDNFIESINKYPYLRHIIRTLLIVNIYNRDKLESIIKNKSKNDKNFQWLLHIKYYIKDRLKVNIYDYTADYGEEFFENYQQTIITPETERCYMSLIVALRHHLFGALEGYHGYGKTETIKSLGQALGKYLIIFKSRFDTNLEKLYNLIRGMTSSGCWLYLEDFHKINPEIMSVISHELNRISECLKSNLTHVFINNHDFLLDHSCFMCISVNPNYNYEKLPESLKIIFRPVTLLIPDYKFILSTFLLSIGLKKYRELSHKIVYLFDLLENCQLNFNIINLIINEIEIIKINLENEENLVSNAIYNILKSRLKDFIFLENILPKLFECPDFIIKNYDQKKFTVYCNKLEIYPEKMLINKLNELNEILDYHQNIVVFGEISSGKSTLIKLILEISKEKLDIDLNIINPKSLVYDHFDQKQNVINSILSSLNDKIKWVIFDSEISSCWIDDLNTVLDKTRKLYLQTGEIIYLEKNLKIIFETCNLNGASPRMLLNCGFLYVDKCISWKAIIFSWISNSSSKWILHYKNFLLELFNWFIPPCLEFIKIENNKIKNDLILIGGVRKLFEMLLNEAFENILEDREEDYRNYSIWIQALFIQSITWGFNSYLKPESSIKFDEFCKNLWKGLNESNPIPNSIEKLDMNIPSDGLITDYFYVYKQKGNWKSFQDLLKNEKPQENILIPEIFVPTIGSVKYTYFLNLHTKHQHSILFHGVPNNGKSRFMQNYLINKSNRKQFNVNFISFTRGYNFVELQKCILSKLIRKHDNCYYPQYNRQIFFIDDFNLPTNRDSIHELIREYFDYGKWHNCKDNKPICIKNIGFIATINDNELYTSPRLMRHFNSFPMNALSKDCLIRIYSNILLTRWRRNGFPNDINTIVNQIINSTLLIYEKINIKFKLNLTNFLCHFNLEDISKVVRNCAILRKENWDINKKLHYKFWTYEMLRVFSDKFQDNNDKNWLYENIRGCFDEIFNENIDLVFENLKPNGESIDLNSLSNLLYANYFQQNFEEQVGLKDFKNVALKCLNDHNDNEAIKLDIVLFDYALQHLLKICRVLSTNLSHCLLIGVNTTGRRSLVKLACLICKQKFFQPKVISNYNRINWRNDFKKSLISAGGFQCKSTFLVTEEQLIDEEFLEDVERFLKSIDIPDIYTQNEQLEILDFVRKFMQKENIDLEMTAEIVLLFYQKLCLENLHIILSFNLNSNNLRKRLQHYGSLTKYFSIIYFDEWPDEVLEKIAEIKFDNFEIPGDKPKLLRAFGQIHKSWPDGVTSNFSSAYYLDFMDIYKDLYNLKWNDLVKSKEYYTGALEKLSIASGQINNMQDTLKKLEPQLNVMTEKSVEMADQIEKERLEEVKASDLVRQDEKLANLQAAASQALKLDCEADLAQAIPVLEDAIVALNTLKPTDITLVKSMKNPPDAIKLVMAAVCVIKDVRPDRIPDPTTGRKIFDYWGPSKRILGDMNFLQTLKEFDKDNIKPEAMTKIRTEYLPHKDFKPQIVAKASSAAEGLCKWIIAMDMYDKVATEVAPKKLKLEKAEKEFAETMILLNEKREQVCRIEERLIQLKGVLEQTNRKVKILQTKVDICKMKLAKAEKLIEDLVEDKIKWTNVREKLENQLGTLPGDLLIASATVTYLGTFEKKIRKNCQDYWMKLIENSHLPLNKGNQFIDTFQEYIPDSHVNLLPPDDYFIENILIENFSNRWCVFIDPQNQANKWIKNKEKNNNLKTIKIFENDWNLMKKSIQLGNPFLIENIEDNLIFFQNNCKMITKNLIMLGDELLEKNNFKLYLIIKNTSHIDQNAINKLTLINFNFTQFSLENKFLENVISMEKPKLKKMKENLINQRREMILQINQTEKSILKILYESQSDILEDDKCLQNLWKSKINLNLLKNNFYKSTNTEAFVEKSEKAYEEVAKIASVLYLTTFDLRKIENMYRFSIEWFVEILNESIRKAENNKDIEKRSQSLIKTLISNLNIEVVQSIFSDNILLFTFLMYLRIMEINNQINQEELEFIWQNNQLSSLCRLKKFEDFENHFNTHREMWENILDSETLEGVEFPYPWSDNASKLIITKILRPNRLINAISTIITNELGEEYLTPPKIDLNKIYLKSYAYSPLILILTPGTNPVKIIKKFASNKKFLNKVKFVSVGCEENENIPILLREACKAGFWICLENCHVSPNFLNYLEDFVENLKQFPVHEDFRLWITTNPSKKFPPNLLEKSIKIVIEEPEDLRTKLIYFYEDYSDDYEELKGKTNDFKKFFIGLCFFQCNLQKRYKYNYFGWNMPCKIENYNFNLALEQYQSIINNNESIYLIGQCNYYSHISNQWDQRLLLTLLSEYLNNQEFKDLKKYHFKNDISCYVENLQLDNPEIYGLPKNVDIFRSIILSKSLLNQMNIIFASNQINTPNKDIKSITNDLLKQIPESFNLNRKPIKSAVDLVLRRETIHYNKLINLIRSNLIEFSMKLENSILEEIEIFSSDLLKSQTPDLWLKNNNYSKNLSVFVVKLQKQHVFLKSWVESEMGAFQLDCLFNPKALLIAIKLDCNKTNLFNFYRIVKNLGENNKNEIPVCGLSLTGANWDENGCCLEELPEKILKIEMPTVIFAPFIENRIDTIYECPFYQNPLNYISLIIFNSKFSASHWIKRNVILYCHFEYD